MSQHSTSSCLHSCAENQASTWETVTGLTSQVEKRRLTAQQYHLQMASSQSPSLSLFAHIPMGTQDFFTWEAQTRRERDREGHHLLVDRLNAQNG